MDARVILTLDCNRKCPNCCNSEEMLTSATRISDIKELLDYDAVIITGGEPMLYPDKVMKFIDDLYEVQTAGKMYKKNIW